MRFQLWIKLRSPIVMLFAVIVNFPCTAQNEPSAAANPEDSRYTQLAQKLDQVLAALDDTQRELVESRRQMRALELRVQALDEHAIKDQAAPAAATENHDAAAMQSAVRELQENTAVLQAEVKQHDQTKVESSSKYPIKISGMLLSSTNLNDGAVDNVDLPVVALPRSDGVAHGSLATTWRQTILGLDARGPSLWGAHSAADIHTDFFGKQETGNYGTNGGSLRLRTAHFYLNWPDSSLILSLDKPLISPLEPTSYLTVAAPALAWSGNLWSWSPQLEFKHSIAASERGNFGIEAGLIDPAATESYYNQNLQQSNASETSKQPGYETRFSYSFGGGDHTLTIGASGYYARQKYPYHKHIDSWAGTADWKLPLAQHFELSGELYRGRALGGLGGGTFKDYVSYGTPRNVVGLNDEGGWTQLKAMISPSVEMNAAIGQDSAFAAQVRGALSPATATPYYNLVANRAILGNVIYRPRAYLVLSLEYRKITSWQVAPPTDHSQTVGLAIGYLY